MNSFLDPVELSIASKALRVANYLIDVIVFLIIFIIIFTLLEIFGVPVINFLDENPFSENIISALLYFSFMTFQEYVFKGRSVGKFLTGTIALTENGEEMSFNKILNRNICRLIPFDGLSFLGNLGWHDSISKTRVVIKKEFERNKLKNDSIDQIGQIAEPV